MAFNYIFGLKESSDVQRCLEHIVELCFPHDREAVDKFSFVDGRSMYTPMTFIYLMRQLESRVSGGSL